MKHTLELTQIRTQSWAWHLRDGVETLAAGLVPHRTTAPDIGAWPTMTSAIIAAATYVTRDTEIVTGQELIGLVQPGNKFILVG